MHFDNNLGSCTQSDFLNNDQTGLVKCIEDGKDRDCSCNKGTHTEVNQNDIKQRRELIGEECEINPNEEDTNKGL